jgi:hypothetical protein
MLALDESLSREDAMNKALLNSLTAAERRFITETSAEALADLDEDGALALHTRARRMRDKYVQSYRRAASAAVRTRGGRGATFEENQRDRSKAEIFETSLSRVSRRLGVLASQSAAEIRTERLAAARAGRVPPPRPATPAEPAEVPVPAARRARATTKTTGGMKKDASSRSMGARRQAKRDAR